MQTFKEQIKDLVGTTYDDDALSYYLTVSAKEVLSALPIDLKRNHSSSTSSNVSTGRNIENEEIIHVKRGTRNANEVSPILSDEVSDSGSIHLATNNYPVYYVIGNKLIVKPNVDETDLSITESIVYPTVVHSDTTISNFPNNAEYCVVIASCIKVLQQRVDDLIHEEEDVELATSTQNEITILLGLYKQQMDVLIGGRK